MNAHLQPNGWDNYPGVKLPKTAPGPGSRDRSSRGAAGGVDGRNAQAGSRAVKGLDLAIDASEPIICRWSVEISEPHAQEEIASGIPEVHVLEPSLQRVADFMRWKPERDAASIIFGGMIT